MLAAALGHHALGHASDAQQAFDELTSRYSHNMGFQIAELSAWRGNADEAFRWLDRAAERLDSGICMTKYSPFLRSIRSDPRYAAFLPKMNLPPD